MSRVGHSFGHSWGSLSKPFSWLAH